MTEKKNNKSLLEKSMSRWQRSPLIFFIGIFLTIVLAVPTAIKVLEIGNQYWYETFGWKTKEQLLIDKLAPTQTIEYFNSLLGAPITVDGGEKYTESIYRRRGYWIQAVSDKKGRVGMFSILNCSTEFFPSIKNTPLYKEIILGKDVMYSIEENNFIPHYFISGATAPTYLIDEVPATNPTRYQTLYFGINDACSYDPKNVLEDDYYYDNFTMIDEVDVDSPKIRYLRENMPINFIAITAPQVKISDLRPDFFIGPDPRNLRVLPDYDEAERRY